MFALLKGWFGEKVTSWGILSSLDRSLYRRIDNLILGTNNGTTQLDHVLVSPYGIFVIETKNIRGWIFGDERSAQWTQVLYGKKYRFQNPIRQNYRHSRAIAEKLNIRHEYVHPIVFFIGDCKFKTPMPPQVIDRGICSYIRKFQTKLFDSQDVEHFETRIRDLKQHTLYSKAAHLSSLRERHSSTTTCPKCGSELITRVAKRGSIAGSSFLGCSAYPKCRFTKSV